MPTAPTDPAWPIVQEWLSGATNAYRLTPADPAEGRATLAGLDGVTERSTLGALALNAAALVVDDWIVMLGAGGEGHPGLREFNGPAAGHDAIPGALVVAVDLLGGAFAINGGGLPDGEAGAVCYLAADDLRWMNCEMGHSAWVQWALGGDVEGFYAGMRWPGWRDEVVALSPGQGIAAYPPPWSAEGRSGEVARKGVPLVEVYGVLLTTAAQAGDWGPAAG